MVLAARYLNLIFSPHLFYQLPISKMSTYSTSVKGKVAIVTGGSRGLGLYCVESLLDNGISKVYLSSRNAKACAETVAGLDAKYGKGRAFAIPADVSSFEGNKHLHDEFVKLEPSGKLDILIANAGATWGEPFDTHPDAAFDKVMKLNVKGVFQSIQAFVKNLENAGSVEDPSRVIIMGSIASLTYVHGVGGTWGYAASKAAIHHVAKNLAQELGPRKITVNVIAPGFFPTRMTNGVVKLRGGETEMGAGIPRGRLGKKEDMQALTAFLVSKSANYLTGVIIPLDGGSHLAAKF